MNLFLLVRDVSMSRPVQYLLDMTMEKLSESWYACAVNTVLEIWLNKKSVSTLEGELHEASHAQYTVRGHVGGTVESLQMRRSLQQSHSLEYCWFAVYVQKQCFVIAQLFYFPHLYFMGSKFGLELFAFGDNR